MTLNGQEREMNGGRRNQPEIMSKFVVSNLVMEPNRLKRDVYGDSFVMKDSSDELRYVYDTPNLDLDPKSIVDTRIYHEKLPRPKGDSPFKWLFKKLTLVVS